MLALDEYFSTPPTVLEKISIYTSTIDSKRKQCCQIDREGILCACQWNLCRNSNWFAPDPIYFVAARSKWFRKYVFLDHLQPIRPWRTRAVIVCFTRALEWRHPHSLVVHVHVPLHSAATRPLLLTEKRDGNAGVAPHQPETSYHHLPLRIHDL